MLTHLWLRLALVISVTALPNLVAAGLLSRPVPLQRDVRLWLVWLGFVLCGAVVLSSFASYLFLCQGCFGLQRLECYSSSCLLFLHSQLLVQSVF